jgi:serine/threonine protein phosphatase PrpC
MQHAVQVRSGEQGEDRAIVLPLAGGCLVALADGAGGTGDGAAAAQAFIASAMGLVELGTSADWFAALCAFDEELSLGGSGCQTTGIVAWVNGEQVSGASVGDSSAYLISPSGAAIELTGRQRRKPLLGSKRGIAR